MTEKNRTSQRSSEATNHLPDFRQFFETLPDRYLILTPDFKIVAASDAYLTVTLTNRDEIVGRGIFDVFPENPAEKDATGARNLKASLERVLRNKTPDAMGVVKYDIQRPGGGGYIERYWNPCNFPVIGADGMVAYLIIKVDDVTQQILTERVQRDREDQLERQVQKQSAELHNSEERFRILVEGTKDYAIFILTLDGIVSSWNPGAEQIKGYRADEIIGSHFSRFYPEEDVKRGKPEYELKVAAAVGRFEEEGLRLRKDGSTFWASVIISALRDKTGSLQGFSKITRDITEKRHAHENEKRLLQEAAAREAAELNAEAIWGQRQQLLVTLRSIGDGVIATDSTGRVTLLNPVAEDLTGWTERQALGKPLGEVLRLINEETRLVVDNPVAKVLHNGIIVGLANHTILIAKDGRERPIADSAAPIRNELGQIIGVVLVFRDYTERRNIEERIRLRDRAIEAVSHGILITDPLQADNPIIYCSDGFKRLTGYTAEDTLGKNCRFLQGKETDPDTVLTVRQAIQEERECSVEVLNYRKDGSTFWNALFVTPVRDEQGRLLNFVGVQADVTERRTLEQALNRSQRMEAVGQLAGGIAHDFNNVLTALLGACEILELDSSLSESNRELTTEIRKAGDHAATLTRQLLAFSRQQLLQARVLNLNEIVIEISAMLERLIGEDVALATNLYSRLWSVKVDKGQIEQVIMNLAVNARDAMQQGGKLTIETSNVELDRSYTRQYPDVIPGPYVLLSVTDTGCGMDDATKSRMFEPFFTTKGVGKGTGLGLATVFGIVKQSSGHVTVYSELGYGSTFKVYLPKVNPVSELKKDRRSIIAPARGTETVLVVEDNDSVRFIACRTLRSSGYSVLEARNGKEAIAIYERQSTKIDLVLTDVVMPEIGGRKLSELLLAKQPDLKLLFMSGYTDDAVMRHGVLESDANFIQKPFMPVALAQRVREVLDCSGPT